MHAKPDAFSYSKRTYEVLLMHKSQLSNANREVTVSNTTTADSGQLTVGSTAMNNRLNGEPTPVLALRPKRAALALGIGVRKLWELTNRGEIPHARLGTAIVYPVTTLREWLQTKCK